MKIRHILLLIPILLMGSCIEEYNTGNRTGMTDILVVDGTIIEGTSIIRLSKSIALGDKTTGSQTLSTAKLYMECDDGTRSDRALITPYGYYHLNTGQFDMDKSYRLYIEVDNDVYVSEFLRPLPESKIDKMEWTKSGNTVTVTLDASSDDYDNRYFSWRYNEYWEVHSPIIANWVEEYINGELIEREVDLTGPDNYAYCWNKDNMGEGLNIRSVDRLTENIVKEQELMTVSTKDFKLSYLYCVEAVQTLLRPEAYTYYNNIIKNSEQSGNIFSNMPLELNGNIKCVTDSRKRVVGYVDVGKAALHRIFISKEDGVYNGEGLDMSDCETFTSKTGNATLYTIFLDPDTGVETRMYTYPKCIDCREWHEANKNRPSFWPNEHY